jgi:uncharacterized repeat protein (TIGR01451 family)
MDVDNRNRITTRNSLLGFGIFIALLAILAYGGTVLAQVRSGVQAADAPSVLTNPRSAEFNAILQASQSVGPAVTISGSCLEDVAAPPLSGLNCTANDVTLAQAGVVTVLDPCSFPGDTATFTTTFNINSGASERYDIGIYFAQDGGGPDGALSGQCNISTLDFPGTGVVDLEGIESGETCGGIVNGRVCTKNSDCTLINSGYTTCSAVGPAQDTCGDIASNVPASQALTLTVTCNDADNDGILNVPYCTAWSNSKGDLCRYPLQAIPGTAAKCNCQTGFEIPVEVPPIGMDIEKTPDNVTALPNQTFNYTLTYTNTGDNAPTSPTATNITVSDTLPSQLRLVSYSITGGIGTCTPAPLPSAYGATVTCTGLPNLAEFASNTITLTVQVNPTAQQPANVTNTACVEGYRLGSLTLPPGEDCDTVNLTTPVTVAYFNAASAPNGGVRFEWTTATETDNAGFNLYVRNADGYTRLNEQLIMSQVVDSTAPTDYAVELADVPDGELFIEDVALNGELRTHGPFRLDEPFGQKIELEPIDWPAINAEVQAGEQSRAISTNSAAARTAATNSVTAQAANWPAFELGVTEDGIYRLTYEEIKAATGVDLNGLAAGKLALTNRGVPVPIYVSATTMGPGVYIEFIGEALDTLYTDTNIYRLVVNRDLASRVARSITRVPRRSTFAPYYMETATVEANNVYNYRAPNGDPWIDTLFSTNVAKSWPFKISVDNYLGSAAPASISVDLWGVTELIAGPDHHALLNLNNQLVADVLFDANEIKKVEAPLPAGALVEGENNLTLTVPVDMGAPFDIFALESYSITYPRAFKAVDGRLDFTAVAKAFSIGGLDSNEVVVYRVGIGRPTRLMGAQVRSDGSGYKVNFVGGSEAAYYVSTVSALRMPTISVAPATEEITGGTADLLIVTHPNFKSGLAPLVQARQAQGYVVKVVDVTQVYAQYSGGIFDVEALRDYIHHAITTMGVDYVILVGGDTTDYRDYLNKGGISFIPSLYAPTIRSINLAPVDPLFTDIDGDGVPNVPIGRFPVRTAAELQMMVDKTLAYGANSNPGTSAFFADNGFHQDSETFAQALSQTLGNWRIDRAYMSIVGGAQARTDVIAAMNRGPRLASFVGHSSAFQWTTIINSPLFNYADAAALTNSTPMVVSQWGCWNTYYVDPSYSTLGHKFLLSGLNGAAAVTGSTTLTNSNAERELGRLMAPLMTSRGVSIGDAMQAAKEGIGVTNPEMVDVLLGWTILGDPTLVVQP